MTVEVAVLIPCHNEAAAITAVVRGFRERLPAATIYVYDNNSTDDTGSLARRAGAIVRSEPMSGKGNVVRRMFADIEADVYLLVDGDDTYDPAVAPAMVNKLIDERLDMVVATRLETADQDSFPSGHRLGNRLFTRLVGLFFGDRFTDVLSGYRVLTRRFVKSFPGLSSGFEIETELTIHALQLRMPVAEVASTYRSRGAGSQSKLNTIRDGTGILRFIIFYFREIRPLLFFSLVTVALAAVSLLLAAPVFTTYLETGLVPRLPTAILATGIMILAFSSLVCGLVLDGVAAGRWEAKRRAYLAVPLRYGPDARPALARQAQI